MMIRTNQSLKLARDEREAPMTVEDADRPTYHFLPPEGLLWAPAPH